MYGCESWTIKKAECQIIDAVELWCWRRLLRVLWTARRSNQSILKEISPECSLEGLMLKLKLQCFGHLIQRADSLENPWCWERLKAGGEGDDRGTENAYTCAYTRVHMYMHAYSRLYRRARMRIHTHVRRACSRTRTCLCAHVYA